jgi:hypothetical protein
MADLLGPVMRLLQPNSTADSNTLPACRTSLFAQASLLLL